MLLVLASAACDPKSDEASGDAGASDASAGDASVDAGTPSDAGADAALDAQVPNPKCKRGIAYGRNTPVGLEALSKGVHWWYNWASAPEASVASSYRELGLAFVPMVWGGQFTEAELLSSVPEDAQDLLGFNEPNFKSQANLTAAEAAFRWPELEKIAEQRGLALASPAVNFCGPQSDCHDTDPFAYLDAFFALCKGCRVDYVAAHWYACDGPALSWYLGRLRQYQRPIWFTEFACGDGDAAARSLEGQKRYMKEAVEILELEPTVARYAWFAEEKAIANVNLVDEQGQLTELGELYVSLPHYDSSCAR